MTKQFRALVGQSHPVDAAEDKRIQDLTAKGTIEIPDRKMAHFDEGEIVSWLPPRNVQPFIDAGYLEEVK